MFFSIFKNKRDGNGRAPREVLPAGGLLSVPEDKYWSAYRLWQPRFERMSAELIRLSGEIEDEFLAVGNNIQEFSQTCSRISSLAGSIGHMIEGGSGFKADAFNSVFEHAYGEIESCCSMMSDKVCRMCDIIPRIDDILELKEFLEKLAKSITILGTLIRIETSRVTEAEFGTMTEAVDDLAHQIGKNTAELSLSAINVNRSISLINEKMSENKKEMHEELEATRTRMSEILGDMENMTNQAKLACKRMEGRSSQISDEIGEVIVSLQYHDICRQQMEHVSEALGDIISKIATMNSVEDNEKASFGHWITEAIGIQILQLEHVVSGAVETVKGISGHLARVAGLSGAQQEDANMILEDEEEGSHRIVKITKELESLSSLMSESKEMMTATVDEISGVNATVGGMSEQVSNIELISDNINLLALNAILKVGRTGEAGRGLGVLADEIRKLSTKATEKINKGASAITNILEGSSGLGRSLSEEMGHRLLAIEDVFVKTDNAVKDLLKADETMIKSMNEITGITKTLEKEIEAVISGIKFDVVLSAGIGKIASGLREMLAEVEATIPDVPIEKLNVNLDDLKGRYTIHSERRIHESRSADVKDDQGGNVEFF